MAGGGSAKGNSRGVRIVVAGDRGTGKSSLIVTAAADTFLTNAPTVLSPTRLPEDIYPERVTVTIIDTSSREYKWVGESLQGYGGLCRVCRYTSDVGDGSLFISSHRTQHRNQENSSPKEY